MGGLSAFGDHRGYLLDTHAFYWAAKSPDRLGKLSRLLIEDPETRLYLSSVSAYEATFKQQIGKLSPLFGYIVTNYTQVLRQLGVEDLPLTLAHGYLAGSMEWAHRDPFDRFIVAQASLENLVIITNDVKIQSHPWVDTIW